MLERQSQKFEPHDLEIHKRVEEKLSSLIDRLKEIKKLIEKRFSSEDTVFREVAKLNNFLKSEPKLLSMIKADVLIEDVKRQEMAGDIDYLIKYVQLIVYGGDEYLATSLEQLKIIIKDFFSLMKIDQQ